jgi:hypothetical protein
MKVRTDLKAVVDLTLPEVRKRLPELAGRVVELYGTVSGIVGRRGHEVEGRELISFLLHGLAGDSVFIECARGTPEVVLAEQVRVLVRLDPTATRLEPLRLTAILPESEVPEQWQKHKPPPKAPATAGPHTPGAEASGVEGEPDAEVGEGEEVAGDSSASPASAPAAAPGRNIRPQSVKTVFSESAPRPQTLPFGRWPYVDEQIIGIYNNLVGLWNPRLSEAEKDLICRCILGYSQEFGLDHRFVFSVVAYESGFNPWATSPVGAMGLGQLMPGTAAALGVNNPYDIAENLRGAAHYLSQQVARYRDRSARDQFCLTVASYNAGPERVRQAGGVPNIPETINFVNRVGKLFYELYQKGYP